MAVPSVPLAPASVCIARGLGGTIWDHHLQPNLCDPFAPVCTISSAPTESRDVAAPFIAAAFNKNGEFLATLDKRRRLTVFVLKSNRYAVVRRGGAHGLALKFSLQQRCECFVSLENGKIECFNTETKTLVGVLKGHSRGARSLACHPHRPVLASAAPDAVILWSTAQLSKLRVLSTPPSRSLQGAIFAPDGLTFATLFERGVTMWDLQSFRSRGSLQLPLSTEQTQIMLSIAISYDSTLGERHPHSASLLA